MSLLQALLGLPADRDLTLLCGRRVQVDRGEGHVGPERYFAGVLEAARLVDLVSGPAWSIGVHVWGEGLRYAELPAGEERRVRPVR